LKLLVLLLLHVQLILTPVGQNNGVLNYTGTAEVSNVNSSNNLSASGGGNVYFTNTIGTYLQVTGFNPSTQPNSTDFTFAMYGYDANNLSELALEYSTDGVNYTPLTYKRLFRHFMAPTPWDVMVSDPIPANVNLSNLVVRFRQTTITKQFRVDDFQASFYYTLPITLSTFSGIKKNEAIQLTWRGHSTATNEYFTLERSLDGRNFNEIWSTNAQGDGDYSYYYNDINWSGDKTFYRLKMTDLTGKTNYSQIIFVQAKKPKSDMIQTVYPVPANQAINTTILSNGREEVVVIVTDGAGRTMITNTYSVAAGINNCVVNVKHLNPGLYFLKVIMGNSIETKQIVIAR
jgi:hypothetical protein